MQNEHGNPFLLESDYELTKDIPYLAFTVELYVVFCEYFGEKTLL